MFDIWGFLLQTLTASGVAVLLIVIKALFKDKLPPKWHFAVWGVLAVMLLIPAGWNGRYTIIHWQYFIELIKGAVREFGFTRVLFPIPIVSSMPHTLADWIFAVYFVGVILHLAIYLISYIRLRFVLNKGEAAPDSIANRVKEMSEVLKVKPCRVIEVRELPSAFVCGIIRPVLVIPAGEPIDDKIFLHELMHLKSKDTLWSVVICILRSIHWCNPLMVYCANSATNDMEYRCDQFVLEKLEGEERRAYGHILLSMVNDRFAKTPGTTCVNNGGKHIRDRIETIARFKKYPAGMKLVSVCVLILLSSYLVIGVQASKLYEPNGSAWLKSFASARSIPCTTYAGAFDTYGKAVLEGNGHYRVMCAPYSMQEELYKELVKTVYPKWDFGIPSRPDKQAGYYVYNLKQLEKNVYEGLMVFKLDCYADIQSEESDLMYLAVQNVRAEKENGRWVAIPTEEFRTVEAAPQSLQWGCEELPCILYSGVAENMQVNVKMQTVYTVANTKQVENSNFIFESSVYYDTDIKPNTKFTQATKTYSESLTHLGTVEERNKIEKLGVLTVAVYSGDKRPEDERPEDLTLDIGCDSSGGSTSGGTWGVQKTKPGWGPSITFGGGGWTFDPEREDALPEYYVATLYVNNEIAAQLDLYPQKGAAE